MAAWRCKGPTCGAIVNFCAVNLVCMCTTAPMHCSVKKARVKALKIHDQQPEEEEEEEEEEEVVAVVASLC